MKVLITGAGGFLGREVVVQAVAAGHDVTALVRPRAAADQLFDSSVTVVQGDLRSRGEWCDVLGRIDVVVHAAAAASGSRAQQLANTVVATERLLEALGESRPTRFVHVSSLSVYDFHAARRGSALGEYAPLESRPRERDPYTEAKLVQERLVRQWCEARGVPCVILRPGAIVGPGKTWGYGAALGFGRLAFVVAPRAQFRFVSLSNCADAVVKAVDADVTGTEVVNIIDDRPPTHAEYFRRCMRAGAPARTLVPVPWFVMEAIGKLLQVISLRMFGGRLRTPELLDHRRQEARWKPLTYSNDAAHRVLGWRSTETVDEAIRLAVGPADREAHSINKP